MTQLEKIKDMLRLQDEFNIAVIGENWKVTNTPWYRAIWLEAAEMLEQTDWKWWKHKDENINHIVMELVDIWHFGISDMLINFKEIDKTAAIISKLCDVPYEETTQKQDLPFLIEGLVEGTLLSRSFNVSNFLSLCRCLNIDIDKLYNLYIGKNILNIFRQKYGYDKGHYIKMWDGREDNDYLIEFTKTLDMSSSSDQNILITRLTETYEKMINN